MLESKYHIAQIETPDRSHGSGIACVQMSSTGIQLVQSTEHVSRHNHHTVHRRRTGPHYHELCQRIGLWPSDLVRHPSAGWPDRVRHPSINHRGWQSSVFQPNRDTTTILMPQIVVRQLSHGVQAHR
jgi:hypothetical protein